VSQITADAETIASLKTQYGETVSLFNEANAAVNSARSALAGAWQSSASTTFGSGLDAWITAFQKLNGNVLEMGEAMAQQGIRAANIDTTTNDYSSGWASIVPTGSAG
jgi:uncharacterized protein YukE